jgi:restriction endonuclease Mrr
MTKVTLKALPALQFPDGTALPALKAEELEEPVADDLALPPFAESVPVPPPSRSPWQYLVAMVGGAQSRYLTHRQAWELRRDEHESRHQIALDREAAIQERRNAEGFRQRLLEKFGPMMIDAERQRQLDRERSLRSEGLDRAVALSHRQAWLRFSGGEFERHVAWLYARQGWSAHLTPVTGDGGVDIVLKRGSNTMVVQCKAHASPQGAPILRDLFGAMADFKATGAILCTFMGVTDAGRDFASRNRIQVLDVDALVSMAKQVSGLKVK